MVTDVGQQIVNEVLSLDIAHLSRIVQGATGSPSAIPARGWKCAQFSPISVGSGTVGFFKVEGIADVGGSAVPWSSVIKVINPTGSSDASSHRYRFIDPLREIESYRSGFLEIDRGGMTAAPCFKVDDRPDGSVWLWMTNLTGDRAGDWTREAYLAAARDIGYFNASLPESAAPDAAWLDRTGITDRRKTPLDPDNWSYHVDKAIGHPVVRAALDPLGIERVARLRDDLAVIIESTAHFPRAIAHNDCHTRNLFSVPTADGNLQTYGIDWASVGLSPLGLDGGSLAASGFTWGPEEAMMMHQLEPEIFDAYYRGACEAGWTQPRDQVRLAYLSTIATYAVQIMVSLYYVEVDSPGFERALERIQVSREGLADETVRRLSWLIPLVDEALTLSRTPA